MKQWTDILKNLTMLTQFGLSLLTPLLMCLGICWWISDHFGIGGWIYILGFFFGLGGSAMVAWKLYISVTKREKKEGQRKTISFNRHI